MFTTSAHLRGESSNSSFTKDTIKANLENRMSNSPGKRAKTFTVPLPIECAAVAPGEQTNISIVRARDQAWRTENRSEDLIDDSDTTRDMYQHMPSVDNPFCSREARAQVFSLPDSVKSTILKVLEQSNESVVLTTTSRQTSTLFLNFIEHAQRIDRRSFPRIIAVTLDGPSLNSCMTTAWDRLACIDAQDLFPAGKSPASPEVVSTGSCEYDLLTFVKPSILRFVAANVKPPFGVLLSDVDVVLRKNVLPCAAKLAGGKHDSAYLLCNIEDRKTDQWCNSGFLYAKPSSLPLLDAWINRTSGPQVRGPGSDQDFLNDVLRLNPEFRGHVRHFDQSLIGQCGDRGTLATHYSCMRARLKIESIKMKGDWLLS